MEFLTGLIKIMLEHRAEPGRVMEDILCPKSNPIADSTNYEETPKDYNSNYNSPINKASKDCSACGGTGEDSDRYEPLFDIYAPCPECHGNKTVPIE